jgi:hypothetical protein
MPNISKCWFVVINIVVVDYGDDDDNDDDAVVVGGDLLCFNKLNGIISNAQCQLETYE